MRLLVTSVAMMLAAAFAGSFAGAWHPLGDSLAVFRLPIAAALALVVIWSGWPALLRWLVAALCIAAMGQIVAARHLSQLPGSLAVYQKNLLFKNTRTDAFLAEIAATDPDVITLQEVSTRHAAMLDALRDTYPNRIVCPFTRWASVAVLSRLPVEGRICLRGQGFAGLEVQSDAGPVWVTSLHLHWPWPHSQPVQRAALLPVLSELDAPVVIGGDFNMVPWSHSLRQVQAATGTQRAGPVFASVVKRGAPLPIDHVLAPGGGLAEKRPLLGSDHHGILARVHLTPP